VHVITECSIEDWLTYKTGLQLLI